MKAGKRLTLDYAPLPVWYRRGNWRRGMIWLLLCAFGWPAGHFGPALWHQSKYLSRQQECLDYAAPRDRVVYDDDPAEASRLMKNEGYGPVFVANRSNVPGSWQAPAGALPAPWKTMGGNEAGITFLHHRRSTSGKDRLIAVVAYLADATRRERAVKLDAVAFVPAGWRPGAELKTTGAVYSTGIQVASTGRLRLFSGQADPRDLSHFTIRYELNGKYGLIDGWLRENDELEMSFRDSPPRRTGRNPGQQAFFFGLSNQT